VPHKKSLGNEIGAIERFVITATAALATPPHSPPHPLHPARDSAFLIQWGGPPCPPSPRVTERATRVAGTGFWPPDSFARAKPVPVFYRPQALNCSSPRPFRERIEGEGPCAARDSFRARLKILLLGWPVIGNGRAGGLLELDHGKKTKRCALCHRAPLNVMQAWPQGMQCHLRFDISTIFCRSAKQNSDCEQP
jgi:hypothetical protein